MQQQQKQQQYNINVNFCAYFDTTESYGLYTQDDLGVPLNFVEYKMYEYKA